jgi:hypothetical protein
LGESSSGKLEGRREKRPSQEARALRRAAPIPQGYDEAGPKKSQAMIFENSYYPIN